MKLDTLYKLDSKGKTREWDCEVVDNKNGTATIIVTYGLQDGQKIIKETLIKSGKNISKSNETTVLEQAESEARSKWEKQRDKGYATNSDTGYLNQESIIGLSFKKNYSLLPMLAHRYDKFSHKIEFPAYMQPKLDGIRCLGLKNRLQSRMGKPITSLPHIQNTICEILSLPEFADVRFLDGELFSTNMAFQEITSIVRKQDPPDNHREIEFHVYDLCFTQDKTFAERYQVLKRLVDKRGVIKIVETVVVTTSVELQRYTIDCVKKGYEGGMVRNAHGKYELDKRSYNLQKIKTFQDGEFEIVNIKEDKDGGAVFTCRCGFTTFDVRPEGTIAQRKEYLNNIPNVIGKNLSVRYFEMTTSENPVPRFPVGVEIRDYE